MRSILFFLILLILLVHAGTASGIKTDPLMPGIEFVRGVTWSKVLEKAKRENKYIFVDCYTTWCGPCRTMDKDVYSQAKVGGAYNDRFICVKMQMDSAKNDDESIRATYKDAIDFGAKYGVRAYPTLLYFTPDGKLLNKDVGLMDEGKFIDLAADVLNPEKNYYLQLEKYGAGKMDVPAMAFLARMGITLGDSAKAYQIADTYIHRLNEAVLLTRDNIQFMRQFTKNSSDRGFSLFYQYADSIDRIMADDTYAEGFTEYLISKELLVPFVAKSKADGTVPDWMVIQGRIKEKYNEYYAERVIVIAQCNWAARHKNWEEWSKYYTLYEDKYGSKLNTGAFAASHLNNAAWIVFNFSTTPAALHDALFWSTRAIMMEPNAGFMDTYANLLYKLGESSLAIRWERIAVTLEPDTKLFQATLAKMKSGAITWEVH